MSAFERLPVGYLHLAVAVILVVCFNIQSAAWPNHDVAWLAWGARATLDGAIIGRDLIDPNFPLAFLIYAPAAVIAGWAGTPSWAGLPLGIRVETCLLTFVSCWLIGRRATYRQRPWLMILTASYVAFLMPREFAQREQIALLLITPYCLHRSRDGGLPLLTGLTAGIGFCVKPHFLLVLMFVDAFRRPGFIEQRVVIATVAAYAVSLLIWFPAYLNDVLPSAMHTYDAYNRVDRWPVVIPPLAVALAALIAIRQHRDRDAEALFRAAIGFFVASLVQLKFYSYHFLPFWGLLLLSMCAVGTAQLKRRVLLVPVTVAIVASLSVVARYDMLWWNDVEKRRSTVPALAAMLDKADSFATISVYPFPAFPTALATTARFVGVSCSHGFLPAAARGRTAAMTAARKQGLDELARRPEIVLVDSNWYRHTQPVDAQFDGLAFLKGDAAFAEAWRAYRPIGRVGDYDVYRRVGDGNR